MTGSMHMGLFVLPLFAWAESQTLTFNGDYKEGGFEKDPRQLELSAPGFLDDGVRAKFQAAEEYVHDEGGAD